MLTASRGSIQECFADDTTWIARVFTSSRPDALVRGDAAILDHLESINFPAERLAAGEDSVSRLHDWPVLVTHFVSRKQPDGSQRAMKQVGDSLGRLHAQTDIPDLSTFPSGSLHHVAPYEGRAEEDLRLAEDMLRDIKRDIPGKWREGYEHLLAEVAAADRCENLPVGLVHPDPAPVNLIEDNDQRIHFIDWAGAGLGTRIVSLGQYLRDAAGSKGFDSKKLKLVADAYQAHVTLTDEERLRLPAAMKIRTLWLAGWIYFTRTLTGNPPHGDEWRGKRALHNDPALPDALSAAFQSAPTSHQDHLEP